ncbi:MAG TPA: TonB-dependent receptor plug domain-containing protein [Chitinophagaceae bacterium]|nr:TonB-dependent receptor plug domain-containing protein [Chitinophagaceae bacterium]
MKTLLPFAIFILLWLPDVHAQADSTKEDGYSDMSLKDLLNVKIVSVSKSLELLFEAPLSASVVTKDQIRKAGCTSILEALRLVPGLIVREQSNGNYDIHLRGMDNIPPYAPFDVTSNTTTLVMIDNRVIYSYLKGGTFWETIPIGLHDVEKIEVVRGPASALYGPNAVNGVINIITRQTSRPGLYAVGDIKKGSLATTIANASIGYQLKKWKMMVSGNFQDRNRSQTSYFEFYRDTLLENPDYFIGFNNDTLKNTANHHTDASLAVKKYAGNLFVGFSPKEKIAFQLSTGTQYSLAQRVSTENEITPLSTANSQSRYADLRANINSLSAQFSINTGTQYTDIAPGNKYDFDIIDANIEYNYTRGALSVKPGLAYKSAVYDDTKYSDTVTKTGIFNERGKITTYIASLRSEYKLLNNRLRLVTGIAANSFNYPDTSYISYQFAATYKLNKNNLFRAVYSKASRSSTIFDTYVNQTIRMFPTGYRRYTRMALQGNKDLKLLTAEMFEIGYRFSPSSSVNIDVEVFHINGENYNTLIGSQPRRVIQGNDTILLIPIRAGNLPLKLAQTGVTASVSWRYKKVQVNPFITVQKTIARKFVESLSIYAPPLIRPETKSTLDLKSTPAVFGGLVINYEPSRKLSVNLNSYYYSSQTYRHLSYRLFNDGVRGIDHIKAKLIVNASVSYEVYRGLRIACTGKNILNQTSREFYRTDAIPATFLAAIHYEFR